MFLKCSVLVSFCDLEGDCCLIVLVELMRLKMCCEVLMVCMKLL